MGGQGTLNQLAPASQQGRSNPRRSPVPSTLAGQNLPAACARPLSLTLTLSPLHPSLSSPAMAQNAKTSGGPSSSSGGRKSKLATNPKKGARAIAPKKHSAVVSRSLQKVRLGWPALPACRSRWPSLTPPPPPAQSMSAKINNSIERQMVNAASAGKLNLMKPPAQGGSTGQESTEKAAKCVPPPCPLPVAALALVLALGLLGPWRSWGPGDLCGGWAGSVQNGG